MKELLRIRHVSQYESGNSILRDYNLEVYEGEIIYIQGLSGSGVMALFDVLSKSKSVYNGEIYLREQKINECNQKIFLQNGIYTIKAELELVDNLTVAENIEAIRKIRFLGSVFSKNRAIHKADKLLKKEGLEIRGDSLVQDMTSEQKLKLSIIKAKLYGASLIVLDCAREYYEGVFAEEICKLIKRINKEGISFVILSERLSQFAEIADRIQLVQNGIDLMEWDNYTDEVKNMLSQHTEYGNGHSINVKPKTFLGLYDYYWDKNGGIWAYLDTLKQNNIDFWNTFIDVKPPKMNVYFDGETVVIPKESALLLLNNLEISDNIIITIPERVSGNRFGIIRKHNATKLTEEFYKLSGLAPEIITVGKLNRVQRKMLSIYRWEVAKPKAIILENPYMGMDTVESEVLRNYLEHIGNKGIRIIYFSNSPDEMKLDCNYIISTQYGKNAVLL